MNHTIRITTAGNTDGASPAIELVESNEDGAEEVLAVLPLEITARPLDVLTQLADRLPDWQVSGPMRSTARGRFWADVAPVV